MHYGTGLDHLLLPFLISSLVKYAPHLLQQAVVLHTIVIEQQL